MNTIIKYWIFDSFADKKTKGSMTVNLDGVTEDNKNDLAANYLADWVITENEEGTRAYVIEDFGIDSIHIMDDPKPEINIDLQNLADLTSDAITDLLNSKELEELSELPKYSKEITVLVPGNYLDLPVNTRFWGLTKSGDYKLGVKREDGSALIFISNEVYFPNPDKFILVEKTKTFSLIIKQSPERASNMATSKAKKQAALKGGKKTAAKKSSAAKPAAKKSESGEPKVTKKSIVAGLLKKGLKPAEIVEQMEKDGTPSTLASVRAFIAAINAGE